MENLKEANEIPRIAIAGIAIESSTFSPAVTHEKDFLTSIEEEIFDFYPFLSDKNSLLRKRACWIPTLKSRAMPGGIVSREAYESMVEKMMDLLKKNLPYDGLFFDIHGAMSVVGLDDPEGDLILRIRKVVGYKTLISTTMDLHGNVSLRLAKNTDLITCFRKAPHEDRVETKMRAVVNLLNRLENFPAEENKPKYKAYIPIPVLLPGEKTSTRIEPGKSLYAQIEPLIEKEGSYCMIDAGIWIGYAWADEPRNHGVVMAVGDDRDKVTNAAEKLASEFWSVRKDFVFVAPTYPFQICFDDMAMKYTNTEGKGPFIISDMGDNPTGGGAGDVTWTMHEIMKRGEKLVEGKKSLIYAALPDRHFVEECEKLGVGKEVEGVCGAKVDDRYAPSVRIKKGKILSVVHGDKYAGTEVVIGLFGSKEKEEYYQYHVKLIVTKKRKAYHRKSDFRRLGLNPVEETDILVVKIGYLTPELYEMSENSKWVMALTPGGVDQDLLKLPFKRIKRPMFPFDDEEDFVPNLDAVLVPLSCNEEKE